MARIAFHPCASTLHGICGLFIAVFVTNVLSLAPLQVLTGNGDVAALPDVIDAQSFSQDILGFE